MPCAHTLAANMCIYTDVGIYTCRCSFTFIECRDHSSRVLCLSSGRMSHIQLRDNTSSVHASAPTACSIVTRMACRHIGQTSGGTMVKLQGAPCEFTHAHTHIHMLRPYHTVQPFNTSIYIHLYTTIHVSHTCTYIYIYIRWHTHMYTCASPGP
jgi:hypothetical protein